MADAAADAGERVFLLEELHGLLVLPVVDQGDIALDADMRRAGGLAGRRAALFDAVGARHALGILFENRLAHGEPFVVFVDGLDRADLGAFAAARAFGQVDVPGLFAHDRGEIPGLAFEFEQFGIGEQIDIDMTADLDQFG